HFAAGDREVAGDRDERRRDGIELVEPQKAAADLRQARVGVGTGTEEVQRAPARLCYAASAAQHAAERQGSSTGHIDRAIDVQLDRTIVPVEGFAVVVADDTALAQIEDVE